MFGVKFAYVNIVCFDVFSLIMKCKRSKQTGIVFLQLNSICLIWARPQPFLPMRAVFFVSEKTTRIL